MEIEIERLRKRVKEFQGKTVVVEGRKDVKALKALGIEEVIPLHGRPLIKLIPFLENKEIVILSDFDREGRRIAAKLRKLLQAHKIMLNTRLRKEVMSLRIYRIEDMIGLAPEMDAGKIKTKEGDGYGKVSANIDKVCDKGQY